MKSGNNSSYLRFIILSKNTKTLKLLARTGSDNVTFQVFSEDQSGDMTFSDFLDMLSVMSMQAPKDLKAAYAFKVNKFSILLSH